MKLVLRILASLIAFIPFTIFSQLGAIDTTFNVVDSGSTQVYFESSALLKMSHVFNDGSIITVGEFTSYKNQSANRIVRFEYGSNIDQSFQSNIGTGADSTIRQILVYQNGRIFLSGDFSEFNGVPCSGRIVLNSDGTIYGGFAVTNNIGLVDFTSVAEQNGKTIICGFTDLTYSAKTVKRLDEFGNVDPTFIAPSLTVSTVGLGEIKVNSLGQIYMRGNFSSVNGHPTQNLVRLNLNGDVDVNFTCVDAPANFYAFEIDFNDQVVLDNAYSDLIRLNLSGTIDANFNVNQTYNGTILRIVSLADSSYLLGSTDRILKHSYDGPYLANFYSFATPSLYLSDLDIFPNGDILLTKGNSLILLSSQGARDAAFLPTTGATNAITSVKALPDGKILIAGDFYGYNGETHHSLARIHADGTLDPSFDAGITFLRRGFSFTIDDLEIQADGKILVSGDFPVLTPNSNFTKQVVRLLPNGERDTTFNEISNTTPAPSGSTIIVLDDGSFFHIRQNSVAKYLADGQIDNSFSIVGVSGTIHDAHLLPTGKLLIGGLFSNVNGVSANSLVRINPNGTIDNTFSSGSGTAIYAINSQSNGKVLLSGLGYNGGYNGFNFGYLFRVHENGDFDTTFVLDSIYSTGNFPAIPKITVTTDDNIWVVANLGSISMSQNSGGGLIRLHANGVFDTSQVVFPPIWSSSELKFDIQPSNNVIIGGWFDNYGFVNRRNLTRIIGDTTSPNCEFFDAQFDYIEDLSCTDTSSSVALAINGTPPYLYSWDNQGWNQNDTLFTTSTGGIHFLSISDSVGCSYSTGFLIDGPSNQVAPDNFVNMIAWPFRPGFNTNVKINAGNQGCILSSGQLMVVHDSLLSFNFANPVMPNSIQGDTLIWNFQDLHIDSIDLLLTLNFQTSVNAQIGDSINFQLEIDSLGIDYDVSDNSKAYWYPVVNGYDPNDKSVYPKGECIPNFVSSQEKLEYTVRFQNTGNSYAVNINIVDSLPSDLDLSTLNIVSTSHSMYTEVKPNNVVHFRFDNIFLPDSSSNPDGSLGFVTFQIDQNDFVYQGSEIRNKAHIFFDFNPAIITNEVLNTVSDNDYHFFGDTSVISEVGSYQWETNTYTNSGLYAYVHANQFGCDSVVYLDLTILPDTASMDQSELDKIELVPNPTNGNFKIIGANDAVITVYDRFGHKYLSNEPVIHGEVNLSDVNSGIYFVKIVSNNGVTVKKVVVQH